MVGDFVLGVEASNYNDKENLLIQFWEASSSNTTEDGRKYWELTTQEYKPFHLVYDYNEALGSHRMQSVCRTITIQDDDYYDDDELENDPQKIFIRRVFRNQMPEKRNFLKSCLYIPVYETAGDYYSGSSPCGVMEYVSTCDEYLEKFRLYLGLTFFGQKTKMYIYGNHLSGFGRLNILEHAVLEMDQLLTVVCKKFPLPLAQYWVTTHPHTERLRVMYQQSHTDMMNFNFLDKFKQACMEMRLNIDDEGLVGTAYRSHRTFFCNDIIKELSITNHHLAQYASFSLSIASFVICLSDMLAGKCVLEFFLPQEMISYNPQTLLNSLWETIKEILPSFKVATGQKLVQVSSIEVVKLGEWKSSPPRHEYEGLPSLEDSHLSNILFGQHELIVVDTSSTTNSYNETATGETLGRAHARNSVAEIIHLHLEDESSIKCIEPQSLTSKSRRSKEDLINEENTEEIDHSAPETTLEVAIKHKEHIVAADDSYNETATGETLGRAHARNSVAEIIHLDKLVAIPNPPAIHIATFYQSPHLQADYVRNYGEYSQFLQSTGDDIQLHQHANSLLNPLPYTQTSVDDSRAESSIKCIQPQSLTSKSKRSKEDLINEGNTKEIDHSVPETTLEVVIKHKEHTVAADTVDELVEEPPIVDIGHTMSNEEYTMNTASQISNFEPTISLALQVEEEIMVLDTLAQNSRNILVTEIDDTTIPVVNKTCQEVHTSKREIKPQKDISSESLREHFGRPLDDTAAYFGVSRSTFKRILRVHGIKRWPNGKRTMNDNISSNLKRKLNDEEPSRRNFSRSGMPSSQDTVVAHTSQQLNKMTIKATYNRVTIRFELSDLSGLAELEDNVIERLHLEKKSFSIQYQDDEDDWILIACDKDVQECMEISRSLKKTTIKMSIVPPINNHHAPCP